jgi:peroxiredoxin
MSSRARLLLVAAVLAAGAYVALELGGLVPLALRDRPVPFELAAAACAFAAAWRAPRLRTLAGIVLIASTGTIAGVAHVRYLLPPSSASAGVGEPLPDFTLRDQSGAEVKLRAPGDARPILLVWFRGAWCPYCRRQLVELAAELERTGGGGVRTLAVAPDPPEPLRKLQHESKLPFPLLSDPERRLFNRCELGHCVAIADGQGVVRWGVVSGNWERNLPARALLQAAYRLK